MHALLFPKLFPSLIRLCASLFYILGHVGATDLPRTLRCHIYLNKIAFPVQNMGVIIAELCMVGSVACVKDRCAEFTSDFGLGAFVKNIVDDDLDIDSANKKIPPVTVNRFTLPKSTCFMYWNN